MSDKLNIMKKTLLLIFTFATLLAYSQNGCSPDPQFTAAGIYPDSATGLSIGVVGQAYSENITIVTPLDTVVANPLGGTMTVTIDNIDLTSVTGLPNNFTYACDPPNCSFPGGTIECAELYTTVNPTMADVGLYPIVFETTTHVSGVPIIGTTTQNDVIDYYYIEIVANTTSVFNQYYNHTFELRDVFPNPVNDQARIQFITGNANEVTFSVFNLLGEEVEKRIIAANRGVNDIVFNTSNYSSGVYMYSINNGQNIITKRMIIAPKHAF